MLSVLEADSDVRVFVLTGAGKTFCADGDHTSQSWNAICKFESSKLL